MTETTKNSGEKLSVTPSKTLTLKRPGVEQGVVRQSFSHGRSKAVVVEKVKRRVGPGEAKPEPVAAAAAPKRAGAPAPGRNTAPSPTQSAAPAAPK
ncbi:MAG: translation initiation factor IF-2 associated domain-containing protein, partial [Xanthobacteraceae bacterium]